MPQANSHTTTHHDERVIVLADWRAADAERRREMAARIFAPHFYIPTAREELHRDLVKIECGVRAIGRGLESGSLNGTAASAILKLIHEDLTTAANMAFKLDRKLIKAKRKAKKRG